MSIIGYLSDFGASPGASIRAYVSSEVGAFHAQIVALDDLDRDADVSARWGAGVDLGFHNGREQRITTGSCVVIPAPPTVDGSFTVQLAAWPTTPSDNREQGILSWCTGHNRSHGLWVGISPDGYLEATLGCHGGIARVAISSQMRAREWYRITVAFDEINHRLCLAQRALSAWLLEDYHAETTCPGNPRWHPGQLVFAATTCSASGSTGGPTLSLRDPFNGKLARPSVAATRGFELIGCDVQQLIDQAGIASLGARLLSAWDFSSAMDTSVTDRGPAAAHGFTVNHPSGAVTGPTWCGREVDFRHAPRQYDALHFHDDDLDDARWTMDFEFEVPIACQSGLYGIALTNQDGHDVIPFIVRPPRGVATSQTAVWLPTFTYLAYANQRWSPAEAYALEHLSLLDVAAVQPGDSLLERHPEFGLSLYDCHRDGSPCRYSSRLRPIANFRAEHRYRHSGLPREFAGDVHFLRWLRGKGITADLVTDADLHQEGPELFRPYRAVMTGSHPEYVTYPMHTAVEKFVTGSGRLMYLGGNGLYWVTGVDERQPYVIEVRRGHGGSNPTGDSPPGESHLSTTGELGGLWRHRGRAPQRVLGVGTTALGWGRTGGYAWTENSRSPRFDFVTRGLDLDKPLGEGTEEFPWGAASDEIDRLETALGTPPNADLLATSHSRHDNRFDTMQEDSNFLGAPDATKQHLIRSDIVYAESPNGGRLFSVGSMGWSAALGHAIDVEMVTENVLNDFLARD